MRTWWAGAGVVLCVASWIAAMSVSSRPDQITSPQVPTPARVEVGQPGAPSLLTPRAVGLEELRIARNMAHEADPAHGIPEVDDTTSDQKVVLTGKEHAEFSRLVDLIARHRAAKVGDARLSIWREGVLLDIDIELSKGIFRKPPSGARPR